MSGGLPPKQTFESAEKKIEHRPEMDGTKV